MKRVLCLSAVMFLLMILTAPDALAYEISIFDESVEELKNSLSDEARERLNALGVDDPEDVDRIQIADVFQRITDELSEALTGPMPSMALVIAALLIVSLLEGYTDSLRHTQMKEIMGAVTSLFLTASLVSPLSGLLKSAVVVIDGASALMTIYLPLMVGMMVFTGRFIQVGGYYATVMTAAHVISWLASTVLSPLLTAYLAVSSCAGLSSRIRIKGFCDMAYRFVKWSLTFVMSIFTAILALQTVTAGAADSVASRAARFTLSSMIPVVGAAVSEAYKTLQSSVNLLRSGVGVFALLGLMASFLPVILRVLAWQVTLQLSRHTAVVLNVDSAAAVLDSLSSVLSMLTAIMVSVALVFVISTASLLTIGGAS